ncbi:MAG TPA: hypothetical protein VMV09_02060 [Candidatus Saccharimonadales bacterium]|nr:hypothetical protein [Candidatus Saccharimonadales bacterium]
MVVDRVVGQYEEEAQRLREKGLEEVLERRKAREEKAEKERLAGWERRAAAEKQLADQGRVRREEQAQGLAKSQAAYGARSRELTGKVQELAAHVREARSRVLDVDQDLASAGQAAGLLIVYRERLEAAEGELRQHEAARVRM